MSAMSFARQAFGREKPHSSTSDWIEILTSSNIAEEAYDGIPELVDSINLQASGPAEASRALRKKVKHGNPHQQYRALVLLKALVENCGTKFTASLADGQLTDALRHLANDSTADKRVRKKLLLVLGSWREEYKTDPAMASIAGLYEQCRGAAKATAHQDLHLLMSLQAKDNEKKRREQEKEEAKKRQKEPRRNNPQRAERVPFDFEKEKPKVLASIVEASQASSNLVNAITLVNPNTDNVQTNTRVQDCLAKAKEVRRTVIRYIQLVENEELIGTLIETNDRVIAAIDLYERASESQVDELSTSMENSNIASEDAAPVNEFNGRIRGKGRDPDDVHIHPDLEDLSFGPLGGFAGKLPAPLRPSTLSDEDKEVAEIYDARGSLSDYSDYDSDDGRPKHPNTARRARVQVSDNSDDDLPLGKAGPSAGDPFADPFADERAVGPSKTW